MLILNTPSGVTVSYDREGSGPPLVLVHGSFSDHRTNWEQIKATLAQRFEVCAMARRGRGETTPTTGHDVADEAEDVAALIESLDKPCDLLGHSYGAQVALAAAANCPERIHRLVLYEPPWPHLLREEQMKRFEASAEAGDWNGFATAFLREVLRMPATEIEVFRESETWSAILDDAEATLEDLHALLRHRFEPERFSNLCLPVLLQIGTESPRTSYVTDALAEVLPDSRIEALSGQGHDAMTTAPNLYVASVLRFLR